MKTPEEIKKGLECCIAQRDGRCEEYVACVCCPYFSKNPSAEDSLAYIQQLEAQVPKWISVDERLPDEPGEVLACVYGRICIAWYSNRCFETPSGMVLYVAENAVTYWMPLPEPPKEADAT